MDAHNGHPELWLEDIRERLPALEDERRELQQRLTYVENLIAWINSTPAPDDTGPAALAALAASVARSAPRRRASNISTGTSRRIVTREAVLAAFQNLSNRFDIEVKPPHRPGFVISSQIAEAIGVKRASPSLTEITRELVAEGLLEAAPFKRGNQYRLVEDRLPTGSRVPPRSYRQESGHPDGDTELVAQIAQVIATLPAEFKVERKKDEVKVTNKKTGAFTVITGAPRNQTHQLKITSNLRSIGAPI